MEHLNFALITALYSNQMRGLYSDVYFPIIKYAIYKLFSSKGNGSVYSSAGEIHDFICDRFHLQIPDIVIAKTVEKIGTRERNSIPLEVYSDGNSFKVQKAIVDNSEEIRLEEREKEIADKQQEIEDEYKAFIQREGMYDDGLSFVQFISDNTDDILGFFEDKDYRQVDEKYATMVFFLQYLSERKKPLYDVANLLFWSSIIAAFLKSPKPQVEDSVDGEKKEYFLDTSVVMGLLNLSTPQCEANARDVRNIIQSAGGILRVHPMTLREITNILKKVETTIPNPFTSIASAYERYGYDAVKLANIRVHLEGLVQNEGVDVFPMKSDFEIAKSTNEYKGKNLVKLLGKARNSSQGADSHDNFREIHDVFMHDYIKLRQKQKGDNVLFITNNLDLIAFFRQMSPDEKTMISTRKAILDLWMHNTQPSDVSGCALTATMAMCLEQHSARVRSMVIEVSKYYNQTKSSFDPDIYKDFLEKLYRRAKNVVSNVGFDPDAVASLGPHLEQLIAESVKADKLNYDKSMADAQQENEGLAKRVARTEETVSQLKTLNDAKATEIASLNKELDAERQAKGQLIKEKQQECEAKQAESEARVKAEHLNTLYQERINLENRLKEVTAAINKELQEGARHFHNWLPWTWGGIGAVIAFGVLIVWILVNMEILDMKWNALWLLTIAVPFFAGMIATIHNTDERREKHINKWCANQPGYNDLMSDKDDVNNRLSAIKTEIESIKRERKTH